MLLYSWSKIIHRANTMDEVILIFRTLAWPTTLPSNRHRSKKFHDKNYDGFNFLLNPKAILNKPNIDSRVIVEYLYYASQRNLAEYLISGNKDLDIRLVTNKPNNPLLTMDNDKISFAYE